MGWTPAEVQSCTVAEFTAALEGWIFAKTGERPLKQADVDRMDALMARYPD